MAIGTAPQVDREAPKTDQRDVVIQQQLNRTRRQVWMVELGTSLMGLVIGVLAYLLVLALVDHWILAFGAAARWLALALLVAAVTAYIVRFVFPLVVHSIHPLYAARTIERSSPALKNSVLNFLFFRNQPDAVPNAIYENLKHAAADNLSKVSVDAAVDRGRLIRVLYFLTAVVAVCALYKVASPKDPFQTVSRVFQPWAAIAAPSRVEILEVKPGTASMTFGNRVEISAVVRGVRDSDQVELLFSTEDKQIVDRHLKMESNESGSLYSCSLPPGDDGLQQSVSYRVVAGDAISPQYELSMIAKPMIFVERLQYDFPAYMKRSQQVVQGQGDIEAWEGTTVTLRAKANKTIREAYIEWNPVEQQDGDQKAPAERLERMLLQSENMEAWGSFPLELASDRAKPVHASYQVRFVTDTGHKNDAPIAHRITVLPDLAPQVDILSPRKRNVEVPENGQQLIEVRAVDPDFGLAKVLLTGSVPNRDPWEHELLNDANGFPGQFVHKFKFVPSEIGLKDGDVFTYRATAEDNRQNYQGQPAPNQELTDEYQFTITPPLEARSSPDSQDDNQEPMDAEATDPKNSEDKQNSSSQKDKSAASSNSEQQPQRPEDQSEQKQGENDEPADTESENQKNENKQGQQNSKQPQNDSRKNPSSDQQEGQSDSQQGANQNEQKNPQQQERNQGQEQSGDPSGGQEGSAGGESSESGQSGKPRSTNEGGQPGGAGQSSSDGDPSAEGQDGSGQPSEGSEGSAGQRDPKSMHEGERIEQLLKRIKEEGRASDNNAGSEQEKQAGDPQAGEEQGQQQEGSQQQPTQEGSKQSGSNETGAQQSGAQKDDSQPTDTPTDSPTDTPKSAQQPETSQAEGAQEGTEQERKDDLPPKPDSDPSAGASEKPESTQQPGEQSGAENRPAGEGKVSSRDPGSAPDDKQGPRQPQSAAGSAKDKEAQGKQTNDEPRPKRDRAGNQRPRPEGDKQAPKEGEEGSTGREAPPSQQEKENQPTDQQDKQSTPGAQDGGRAGAGADNKDNESQGAPSAEGQNRDRDKNLDGDQPADKNADDAAGSSKSNQQSDSKGEDSQGDQSGGGGRGGGQNAKQPGTDSPGSSQEADEGQGAGQQPGEGETTQRPGDKQPSDTPTGQAGERPGEGSGQSNNNQGNQQGGSEPKSNQPQANQSDSPNPAQPNGGSQSSQDGSGATNPGGGLPGDRNQGQAKPPPSEPAKEADPNLEYAREATDLVLEYLKDQQQKGEPDQEVLDELGWSKEELDEFVNRWDRLKKTADKDPKARRELDDALRSLGLRPVEDTSREGTSEKDVRRGNTESGASSTPPIKWLSKFNQFRKGAARAEEEEQ